MCQTLQACADRWNSIDSPISLSVAGIQAIKFHETTTNVIGSPPSKVEDVVILLDQDHGYFISIDDRDDPVLSREFDMMLETMSFSN